MPNQRGFTLVELLVVISIIGFLSSIILTTVQSARNDALLARARAEVFGIVRAIDYAEIATNQQLVFFAPASNWTAGFCTSGGHLPSDASCITRVDLAMTQIETATGGVYKGLPRRDPWGIPYQMDANYGESGGCSADSIFLAKPDGTTRVISGLKTIPSAPTYPGC